MKVEQLVDAGRNPPDGVIIHYWLPESTRPESVRLSILDAEGQEIRAYAAKRDKAAAAAETMGGRRRMRSASEPMATAQITPIPT